MDVLCERCGEPWDVLGIRDEFTEEEYQRFHKGQGCPCCRNQPDTDFQEGMSERRKFAVEAQAALRDILGDDIDGLAAEMEDLGLV